MAASITPYPNFNSLARAEQEGVDFTRLVTRRSTQFAILAPHGGGIEPGTSEIANHLAGQDFSLYLFEGLRSTGCEKLHLSSIHYDEPLAAALLQQVCAAVAVHGCAGRAEVVFVGGLYQGLKERMLTALRQAGFNAEEDHTWHAGLDPRNLCNRGQRGEGLQFEISYALRRRMFARLTRAGRSTLHPPFFRFVSAVRKVLLDFQCYT